MRGYQYSCPVRFFYSLDDSDYHYQTKEVSGMVRVTVLLMLLILTIVSSGSSSQAAEEGSVTEGEVVLKTLLEGGIITKE